MGLERRCYARFGKLRSRGIARLGSQKLCFDGRFILCMPFEAIEKARVRNGDLAVTIEQGTAYLELGSHSATWLARIKPNVPQAGPVKRLGSRKTA